MSRIHQAEAEPDAPREAGRVAWPGKRSLTASIQRRAGGEAPAWSADERSSFEVRSTDAQAAPADPFWFATGPGIAGGGSALPHLDTIQRSFGAHDVGPVRAHVGGEAATAASALGATAYATGNDVAFAAPPDLETAAHEAAHVVQQRAGVQLEGGLGEVGDVYERNADEVASAVVRGESAEALLAPFAGRGGAAAAPGGVVQRKSLAVHGDANATYHVRYRPATPIEIAHGHTYIVFLPAGFDPALKVQIIDKLGVGEGAICFTNETTDDVEMTVAQEGGAVHATVRPNQAHKIQRAKQLLTQYLAGQGIDAVTEGDIATLIANQPVGFYQTAAWADFNRGVPGLGSPENTEGLTKPGTVGQRAVGINVDNHTLGAIVHELFHSLEHTVLQGIPNGLVEAMTEYFALQATGLDLRRAQGGGRGSQIYVDNVRLLKLALAKGAVTLARVQRAYFLGELDGIARLIEGWSLYSRLSEKVEFIYTGNVPTPQQLAEVWAQMDTFFS